MELFFFLAPDVAVGLACVPGVEVPEVDGVSAGVPAVGVEGTVGAFALGAVSVEMMKMRTRRRIVRPTTTPAARSSPRRTLG